MRLANGKEEIFKLMLSLFPSDGSASGDCFNLDFFKQLQGVISAAIFFICALSVFPSHEKLAILKKVKDKKLNLKAAHELVNETRRRRYVVCIRSIS